MHINEKGRETPPLQDYMSLRGAFVATKQSLDYEEIASGKEQVRPRNDMVVVYLFNVLYLTRCGVRSLPNFSIIMIS